MRLIWCFTPLIIICIVPIFFWYLSEEEQILPNPIEKTVMDTFTMYQPNRLQMNKKICPMEGRAILLLIAVISSPEKRSFREAIRRTWGYYTRKENVTMAFFIGQSLDEADTIKIQKEQEMYGDFIDIHVIEDPEFPSLKVIYLLEWMKSFCHKAKFLLKTSDDSFINIPDLVVFLQNLDPNQRMIYGRLTRMRTPNRNLPDPNHVSLDEYQDPFFSDFTIGPTYLIPVHLSEELFSRSLNQKFLVSDDVLITGIAAESLAIKRQHVGFFLNSKFDGWNGREAFSLKCSKPSDMFHYWTKVHDKMVKCR